MPHFSIKYLRSETLPTVFCPGCGCGIVMNAFFKAVEEMGYKNLDKFIFCSGIGCSSWIPSPHFKADTIHTLHGRAIPVALGVKAIRPDHKVVVFGGDGDLAAIGLSHLIHAARRNLEITVILVNNLVYAMTGGQMSPLTPKGMKTATTPFGCLESPIDLPTVLCYAGASYVSRWTTAHPIQLKNAIKKALEVNGFSFVEALSQCPSRVGLLLGKSTSELMDDLLKSTVAVKDFPQPILGDKIPIGSSKVREREGFISSYLKLFKTLREG